ncbi:hypothetical protein D3C76_1294790 [compost metagenome]
MARQLADDVLHRAGEGGAVQAGGTGEVVAAAGFLLGLVAVLQARQDQGIDTLGDPLADGGGQQHVHVHAHVMAMLLQRAHRQHHHAIAPGDPGFVFLPGQLADENTLAHRNTPGIFGARRTSAHGIASELLGGLLYESDPKLAGSSGDGRQSSARARCAVSRIISIATSATAAAPTSIQAGASLSPVWLISQVAMKGAVPPNRALAVLKLKAKPL